MLFNERCDEYLEVEAGHLSKLVKHNSVYYSFPTTGPNASGRIEEILTEEENEISLMYLAINIRQLDAALYYFSYYFRHRHAFVRRGFRRGSRRRQPALYELFAQIKKVFNKYLSCLLDSRRAFHLLPP